MIGSSTCTHHHMQCLHPFDQWFDFLCEFIVPNNIYMPPPDRGGGGGGGGARAAPALVAFVHVPKCAGTSVWSAVLSLAEHNRMAKMMTILDESVRLRLERYSDQEQQRERR